MAEKRDTSTPTTPHPHSHPPPQPGHPFASDTASSNTPQLIDTLSENDGLPGYSETAQTGNVPVATAPAIFRQILGGTPGLPAVDFSSYVPVGATLSRDDTTVTVTDATLSNDPEALVRFVRAQAALPPRPCVRIIGHNDTGRGPDFDLRINLIHYFVRPQGQNPWNYVKVIEEGEVAYRGEAGKTATPHPAGGLQEWTRLYCKSKSPNKSFILERELPNWNTPLLEGRIRNLLASLRYHGRLAVSFPVTHTTVVVSPPPPNTGMLPRLLSLFTESRRFSVVRAVWPYANMPASSLATAMEDRGGARRVCAVQSEEEWWEAWSHVIAVAVVDKRMGWVTTDDLMDQAMRPKREIKVTRNWGGRE